MYEPNNDIFKFDREEGKLDEPMNATITFTNPLPITLTELVITIEGPGLVTPSTNSIK